MIIDDGVGKGKSVGVSENNRMWVESESHALAFHQSYHFGQTYTFSQVSNLIVAQNTENILSHIKNTSSNKYLCINHVGVSSLDSATGFIRVYVDSIYNANGTSYTPVNYNRSSGNVAEALSWSSSTGNIITVTGGITICGKGIDTGSPSALLEFDGSIILGLNDTIDVRFLEGNIGTPTLSVCINGFYMEKL